MTSQRIRIASFGLLILFTLLVLPFEGTTQAQNATATPFPTFIPLSVPGSVTLVERRMSPEHPQSDQEAGVELYLTGIEDDACIGIPSRPVDAMLVFDISTSAGAGPGSNWEHTVALTQALLEQLARPVLRDAVAAPEASQVGLVTSRTGTTGPEPLLLQNLTSDYALLHDMVSTLTPSGDTDIAAGLRLAAETLSQATGDRARAVVLMLHDNVAVNETTLSVIHEVQSRFPVYVVVNSINLTTEQRINREIASQMAPDERVFLDPQPRDLRVLFINATGGDTALSGIVYLTEAFSPSGQVKLFEVHGEGGSIATDRVVWDNIPIKIGERVDVGYSFRATGNFSILGSMTWLDCNGWLQNAATFSEEISVSTPLPPTRLPTESLPTTISESKKTPLPVRETEIPGGVEIRFPDNDLGIPGMAAWPWLPDWLWLFLLLLLLFLLLWWLWQHRRRPATTLPHPALPHRRDTGGAIPVPEVPERPKTGEDITTDWRREKATDRRGETLGMFLRRQPVKAAEPRLLVNGEEITELETIQLRLREADDREVGEADMTIQSVRPEGPFDGEISRIAHVDFLRIHSKKDRMERGLEELLLERLERQARNEEAHEIYCIIPVAEVESSFFERRGYQARRGIQRERVLSKSLV